ncbi:phenylacetate--CoA ligase family protein [Pelobacter propionicus]|uniref:Coenzyme F390 synthetase-like protein n=1 Tax=Pelobacter propionicus (strain DSM 2379 / NBRC 103807 / OttBd1) TaxID=338966 RepID=A1AMG9_PELPD|nr:AMP-binding protein [Pelobacter propionicus]ABK98539.1 coenzyme F390 synthetase-like protein [Pelobacter propionicus DSM 2379]
MTQHNFQGMGEAEFLAPDRIRRLQEELLARHLAHVASASPFYRQRFREQGIDASRVSLENLAQIPCTTKDQLAERNDDFLAVPMSQVVDIVLSSGTTGRPTTVMYTESDLERLAYNERISFAGCGLGPSDVVLLTCTMDRCFVAGLAYFSGVRSLGAAAIRNGLSSVESHLEIIRRLKPTVLVGVPSFLHKLGRFLESQGLDPACSGVARLVCIGEPVRDRAMNFLKIGENLERLWGARVYSTYASSEIVTSFCECTAQAGGHLHPDLAVVEIVDERGAALPAGEVGEVVVTPLGTQGMPLVRFRTGDLSFLMDEPCRCGRTSPRLGPILGRKQQMLKLRGTTIYPTSINAVLDAYPGISEYYVAASSDSNLSDRVEVFVSVGDPRCSAERIMDKLQAHLRVRPQVVIASEEQVKSRVYPGNARKMIRFVDTRERP